MVLLLALVLVWVSVSAGVDTDVSMVVSLVLGGIGSSAVECSSRRGGGGIVGGWCWCR